MSAYYSLLKMKKKKTMVEQLPLDILENVLSRLPVKSLLQFRCVCKLWREIISDSSFINMQCNRSKEKGNINLIAYKSNESRTSGGPCLVDHQCGTLVELGYLVEGKIVGCCNGVICTHSMKKRKITLLNPSTREYKTSTYSNFEPHPSWPTGSQGFGYDHTLNTYKIVVLNHHEDLTAVYVYYFNTNQWGQTHNSIPYRVDNINGVFLNGTLYWPAYSTKETKQQWFILAFDCIKEEFSELAIPDSVWTDFNYLADYKGQLCLINRVRFFFLEAWMMVRGSWMNLLSINTFRVLPQPVTKFLWYSILPEPGPNTSTVTATAGSLVRVEEGKLSLLDQKGLRWSISGKFFAFCTCFDTLTSLQTLNWKTTPNQD